MCDIRMQASISQKHHATLSFSHVLSHVILTVTDRGRHIYYPHLTLPGKIRDLRQILIPSYLEKARLEKD